MAVRVDLLYPGKADAADTDYPQGRIRNRSTEVTNDGTPVRDPYVNDWQAFFGAVMNAVGVVPDESVDTAQVSQIYDAFILGVAAEMDARTVGYIIETPVVNYEDVSFSVVGQDTSPQSIFFKSDGTKMYMVGNANDTVYQYTLPTPWSLVGASYDSVSFSVAGQDNTALGLFFKSDGTKMYMLGSSNDTVYQYTLPTPWVLTGASYDSVSFSVAGQDTSPRAISFKSDGTKMYMLGNTAGTVYQYTLPTPWVLTGASYDTVSFVVSGQDASPQSVVFKSDGTKMYMLGSSNDTVYQYTLPTPWVLTGASYDSVSFSVAGQDGTGLGLFFKSNGGRMYMLGTDNDSVYQYSTGFVGG